VLLPLIFFTDTSLWKPVLAAFGLIVGDWITEWIRLSTVKSIRNPIIAIESSLVRFSNDLGRVKAVLESFKPWRITERFDYVTTGEWIRGERWWNLLRVVIQFSLCISILLGGGEPW